MKKKNVLLSVLLSFAMILFISFAGRAQDQKMGKKWEIPEKYLKMENPVKNDKSLVSVGKTLYSKHCKACHGNAGEFDGAKAKLLKTGAKSFASAEFQAQKDGEIYYQSFVGRDEMPNFEKKIVENEDRWAVINYLRTLKK